MAYYKSGYDARFEAVPKKSTASEIISGLESAAGIYNTISTVKARNADTKAKKVDTEMKQAWWKRMNTGVAEDIEIKDDDGETLVKVPKGSTPLDVMTQMSMAQSILQAGNLVLQRDELVAKASGLTRAQGSKKEANALGIPVENDLLEPRIFGRGANPARGGARGVRAVTAAPEQRVIGRGANPAQGGARGLRPAARASYDEPMVTVSDISAAGWGL